MSDVTRREFMTTIATAAAVVGLNRVSRGAEPAGVPATQPTVPVSLHWLEVVPASVDAATGTIPWPKGALSAGTKLSVTTAAGDAVASQTAPLAYWPDGSIKWTLHTLVPGNQPAAEYRISPGDPQSPAHALVVKDSADSITIDTGVIQCTLPRAGQLLIDNVMRDGRKILSRGQLVSHCQDAPDGGVVQSFGSQLRSTAIESTGPICTVVKIDGVHQSDAGRSILPFTIRLYFHAGSDQIRVIHSFVYDLDEHKDFLRGIGIRFDVPMRDEPHNRHVRLVGEEHGLFAEAIRGITGLRRDPGAVVRKAQIDGIATPPTNQWEGNVAAHLQYIPAWGDFTLTQLSADGFQIRKRTRAGYGWIPAAAGRRSAGVGYIGGATGGVAFGMRDFWQKHPGQIDIRDAQTDLAQVTMWLWAPDAPAMDLRFYHDGLGQDTYPKQADGLDTTYEDYEPGYGSPFGIARTSELKLQVLAATPTRQSLVEFADSVRVPAMLVCQPQRFLDAGVFGGMWTLPDRSSHAKTLMEDELEFYLNRYLAEIDKQSWYGFWDYGDVRHAYDNDRHIWRYDIGGFAWDNSELSTDLWLWFSFLRTGRADIFRMAEAMTRHTGEVDVYHLGPHKGLGTRHGVQHWGDSSKQTRISSALYRRPYFYLTGDHRVGELMHDQVSEGETWLTNDVERKLDRPHPKPTRQAAPWGAMAWGELASAWFTEVERTQDPKLQEKLLNSIKSIGELKHGFFSDHATMNLDTGIVTYTSDDVYIEHLTAVFGLPEICCELIRTYGDQITPFANAWAQYGELYNASNAEKKNVLGDAGKKVSMGDTYSRCLAFAAWYRKDPKLAQRVWKDWLAGRSVEKRKAAMTIRHLEGPDVLHPTDQVDGINTNSAAQYSLATMQNLAFAGDTADAGI